MGTIPGRITTIAALAACWFLAGCGEAVPVCGAGCGGGQPDGGASPGLEPGEGATPDPTGAADLLLDFGRIVVGVERRGSVPFVNRTEGAVRLGVEQPPAPYVLTHTPAVLAAGATGAVEFAWRPKRAGSSEAIVTIDAAGKSLRLRLVGTAVDAAIDCPASVEAVRLRGAGLVETVRCTNPTDVSFGMVASVEGGILLDDRFGTVAPGGHVDFIVAPGTQDAAVVAGALVIDGPDGRIARVPVHLALRDGPRIVCDPPVGLPDVPVGIPTTFRFTCTNAGDHAIDRLEARASGEAISVSTGAAPVAPGDAFEVALTLEPARQASIVGLIELTAWPLEVQWSLPIRANAVELPPCDLHLSPGSALDFFEVQPGGTYVQELFVEAGAGGCTLRDLRLEGDPAVWRLDAGGAEQLILEPGEGRWLTVAFSPQEAGSWAASLRFRTSGPVWQERVVSFAGRAAPSCITLDPPLVDFGEVLGRCDGELRTVLVRNDCTAEVSFGAPDTVPNEPFSLDPAPAPFVLAPGEQTEVAVRFAPMHDGLRHAGLLLPWDGAAVPRYLPLRGAGVIDRVRTRTFAAPARKTDLLLVIDNGTAGAGAQLLAGQLDELLHRAAGSDWRIGVTTANFACAAAPAAGSLAAVLDPATPDLHARFDAAVQPGSCAGPTRLFAAAEAALDPSTGFVRPDAEVAVLFVTASDDADTTSIGDVARQLRSLGNRPWTFAHAIFPATSCGGAVDLGGASRLAALMGRLGGGMAGVCDGVAAASELGLAAFVTPARIPLDRPARMKVEPPLPPEGMEVRFDGIPVPWKNGRVELWSYDWRENLVEVHPLYRPDPGAQVEVRWIEGCEPF